MKNLVNTFPKQHRVMVLIVSMILTLLILIPSESAKASKVINAPVVSNYAALSVGESYPLPLDLGQDEANLEFTDVINVEIRNGDSLATIFKRVKQPQKTMLSIAGSGEAGKIFTHLIPGRFLEFEVNKDNELVSLSYEQDQLTTVIAKLADDKSYYTTYEEKSRTTKSVYFEGQIDSNFWNAGVASGLNDTLIMNLANIFAWDVDFALDLRSGDSFYALVEQIYIDGEFVGHGDILAAEFINQDEVFTAVRNDDGRYYTPEGDSMRKTFLRSPVNFKYISSNFSNRRFHPVQKKMKAHRGVDYAANTGTPVFAAGDGKVIKAGYDRFNGHHVFIEHGGGITTKYIHFSKRKVRRGQKVKQGQVIGLVGSTGLAAGPHLHYEFLVNGVHRNPRTVSLPKANPLTGEQKQQFVQYAEERLSLLKHNRQLLLAMR
ncbi:MAG: murein DD-endopeptidase MepM/ murein hydrolase activator NlpD [Psychrosphaera sp.]|jgi:murein DD-endopeptidase MepM/ murein hydrolase activator NlpD